MWYVIVRLFWIISEMQKKSVNPLSGLIGILNANEVWEIINATRYTLFKLVDASNSLFLETNSVWLPFFDQPMIMNQNTVKLLILLIKYISVSKHKEFYGNTW